jgi:hypothetical protein
MNGWGAVFLGVAPDGTALPCHAARSLRVRPQGPVEQPILFETMRTRASPPPTGMWGRLGRTRQKSYDVGEPLGAMSTKRRSPPFKWRAGLALFVGGTLFGLPVCGFAQAQSQTQAQTQAQLQALPRTAASAAAAGTQSPQASQSAQTSPASAQPGNAANVLAPIVVIGTTPLLGLGTPLAQVPANVQTVHASDLDRQHRSTLTDYFEKNLPSVDINEAQGNPYQTDVNYRGSQLRRCSARRRVCRSSSTMYA